jgi:ATP-dependent Lhr-like helicase
VSLSPEAFSEPARRWFDATFAAPTPVQREGWRHIAAGEHALLLAPTGSGKTLAAFFWCIDRLGSERPGARDGAPGVRVLYVSPLKALVHDVERNLRAPLAGIARAAEALGAAGSFRAPRVAMRTGDTAARERRAQGRDPAEILVTTPESLYLILGSAQRETLRTVRWVVVDEIHALAPSKRGAHLALSLERLAALAHADPQRIGLSATARPQALVARYLGGDRPVAIVDASAPPLLDLRIQVPVPDMTRPDLFAGAPSAAPGAVASEPAASLWPAIHPRLLEEIRAHRSTLVFVNSRGLCERLAQRLNELAGQDLVRAHHGSLAHARRKEIEEDLKAGRLRGLVATSSLELGIDMGAVDLVLLVESPGAVARGLQRVGRAGHQVGETSKGRIWPKHRGDLLEATVVAAGMRRGEVEPLRVPSNPLDVLAQQIVAAAAVDPWPVAALEAWVRRAASFRDLSREVLHGVLDMLAGRYPSTDFAELQPRIVWDRERDCIEARKGAGRLSILSGGTIPDRGLYGVHLGAQGPRIGELDEEMVNETRPGETLTLGASSWRVVEITRDRVVVAPAPGEVGKLPFWKGEGPGRPVELGRALGAFVRELGERCRGPGGLHARRAEGEAWLREAHGLDEFAARNLVDLLVEQSEATGSLPTDRAITIERFRDELGDWRVCILSPFGARVHGPWALAIEAALATRSGFEAQVLWNDDGIVLRLADADEPPERERLLPEPEEVEALVVEQLGHSSLFASQFRENAARALLLPRRRPGSRTPLWAQRLRAANLLAVARGFPSFPIVLETYRACLQDVFDLPGLVELLGRIRSREVRVHEVETSSASPFARSLVFAYTASYLYQGDVPLAERRAQALSLDRHMLRELLGQEELRELLDARVIEETEASLQSLSSDRQARHPDALADLLRRLGDLSEEEVLARCQGDARSWLAALEAERRAVRLKLGGAVRWAAAEDVGLYRDALGAPPPAGLPDAFLEPVAGALEQVLMRFARQRGPFLTRTLADRYALVPGQLEPVLAALERDGRLLSGEFHPERAEREWCEPEVLRRLRRHTLARLRHEVAPVDGPVLARFLCDWHGVGREAPLEEALERLEGLPVSFQDLERELLPARVGRFDPQALDELGALGRWVWLGRGPLGDRDGRVALYRRERIALLADPPAPPAGLTPLHDAILTRLSARGASFFAELQAAAGAPETKTLLAALWDLVWWGLVTNDTFAPLRALGAPTRTGARRGRRAPPSAAAGRWSLVAPLFQDPPSETERAHARASLLLSRHGVLARAALALESLAGGFAAVYPVLRAMEEAGRVRRGHFVEGYEGAQFAFAGVVDRLRAARERAEPPQVLVLAAADAAQPYGALLPWPAPRAEAARLRRAAGARVVLADGEPVLFAERAAAQVFTFATREPHRDAGWLVAAARALAHAGAAGRRLRIERIDGQDAAASALAQAFLQAGFRRGYRGLELDRLDPRGRPGPSPGAP